mgnify:FL=1
MRVTLIPAAGASSRMRGGDKLLEDVDGKAILRVLAERAVEACDLVICTLPAPEHLRAKALVGLGVLTVFVPNASEGMSMSLKAGVAALPVDATAMMILPADMPEITTEDMKIAWEHFETTQPPALQ